MVFGAAKKQQKIKKTEKKTPQQIKPPQNPKIPLPSVRGHGLERLQVHWPVREAVSVQGKVQVRPKGRHTGSKVEGKGTWGGFSPVLLITQDTYLLIWLSPIILIPGFQGN